MNELNKISIKITTDYIKLSNAIKFSSLGLSGANSKILIENKDVKVNGKLELRKGKKLIKGDIIEIISLNTLIEVN